MLIGKPAAVLGCLSLAFLALPQGGDDERALRKKIASVVEKKVVVAGQMEARAARAVARTKALIGAGVVSSAERATAEAGHARVRLRLLECRQELYRVRSEQRPADREPLRLIELSIEEKIEIGRKLLTKVKAEVATAKTLTETGRLSSIEYGKREMQLFDAELRVLGFEQELHVARLESLRRDRGGKR